LKNVLLFIVMMIMKFLEDVYNLVSNKYFVPIVLIIILIYSFSKEIEKIKNSLFELVSQFKGNKEYDKSVRSLFIDIKDILEKNQQYESKNSENDEILKCRVISDEKDIISQEELNEILNDVNELLNLPNKWDERAALPIEKLAVLRAKRFILLMDEYNYLTKDNWPEIRGTSVGGVSLSFGYNFIFGFNIEFPPEENQPIRYEATWLDELAKPYPVLNINYAGFSHNPLEVLQILIGEIIGK
jgi:hypothetical protein